MIIRLFILFTLSLALTSCVLTRRKLDQIEQTQGIPPEQEKAQISVQFQNLEEQLRHLQGRLDVIEEDLRRRTGAHEKMNQQYQESFQELWARLKLLEQEIGIKPQKTPKKQTSFSRAEEHLSKQQWQKAALEYEKYRSKNPSGQQYPQATYKIGLAFEQLGDTETAKLFYKEVIEKYPRHTMAKKARYRIKNLKK